jgi:hypothetical protein
MYRNILPRETRWWRLDLIKAMPSQWQDIQLRLGIGPYA